MPGTVSTSRLRLCDWGIAAISALVNVATDTGFPPTPRVVATVRPISAVAPIASATVDTESVETSTSL